MGSQGVGKTKIIKNEARQLTLGKDKTSYTYIDCYAHMKASQMQFRIENKLNQRIRPRTYGPSDANWVVM